MTVEVRGHQMITAGSLADVWAVVEEDGEPKDLSELGTAPRVTVIDSSGATVVDDQEAATELADGIVRYQLLPEKTATIRRLRVLWKLNLGTEGDPIDAVFETAAEVVGAQLFTIGAAMRFLEERQHKLDDSSITSASLEAARARITEDFGEIAGVQFVPRYGEEIVSGSGTANTWLSVLRPYTVLSVAVRKSGEWEDWDSEDVEALELEAAGQVWAPNGKVFPRGRRNVRISYAHGYARPPAEIQLAALQLMSSRIKPSSLPDRAMSLSDEMGTFRLAVAGEHGRWYGLPEVDAALERYSERVPGIA